MRSVCISGNKLRFSLLQPGGAKDPAALIMDLLGANSLQSTGGGFAPHAEGLLHYHGLSATA